MARINSAMRPFFCSSKIQGQAYIEEEVEFEWHSGVSWQVRQRSSDSLKEAILQRYASKGLMPEEILEVSTASHNYEVGQALSALNLIYIDPDTEEAFPVENWFQSSKVFVKDGNEFGPYRELLPIRLAKRYVNLRPDKKTIEQLQGDPIFDQIQNEISGSKMRCFKLSRIEYPLIPRSAFYDYLYVKALSQPQNAVLAEGLMSFRVFTDIMFNPGFGKNRRYNTQARSCAIYVSLQKKGILDDALESFGQFVEKVDYQIETEKNYQTSLFDMEVS